MTSKLSGAAVLDAPEIKDVYTHYRGENLPDEAFFEYLVGSHQSRGGRIQACADL